MTNMDDFESMPGMSGVNVYSFQSDIPILQDDETPEQIFEHICNDMRKVCDEIKKVKPERSKQISYGAEKTVILPEMTTLLENKTNIINQLINHSKHLKIEDFPHFRGEAAMSVAVTMMQETDSCIKAIEHLDNIKCNQQNYLKLLEESEKISIEMKETQIEPGLSDEILTEILSDVSKEFRECKEDMKTVMDTLFSDATFSDVLETLVSKSLSKRKEDEWYEIQNPAEMGAIMMLISNQMVVVNPHNPVEVKLQI